MRVDTAFCVSGEIPAPSQSSQSSKWVKEGTVPFPLQEGHFIFGAAYGSRTRSAEETIQKVSHYLNAAVGIFADIVSIIAIWHGGLLSGRHRVLLLFSRKLRLESRGFIKERAVEDGVLLSLGGHVRVYTRNGSDLEC